MDTDIRGVRTRSRLLFLGSLLFVSGSAVLYVMPTYLDWLGGRLRLNPTQLGELAAVESLGIGITSLLGPLWVPRIDHRLCVLLGIVVCVIGNSYTAFSDNYLLVLILRFGVGLLGEGNLFTVSFAILGRAHNVDRAFAIALTAAVAFGAIGIGCAATLEQILPAFGPLAPLIGIAVAIVPFIGLLSWVSPERTLLASAPVPPRAAGGLAVLALCAQALWFAAPGAFWTFAEKIATDNGIPSRTEEVALSISVVTSLSGCLVAVWLGDRWGRLMPIVGATVGMILSAVLYQIVHGIISLGLLLSLFYALWNYGTVYQLSFVSSLDRSGRAAVMMPAAQVFGLSVGPFCTGWLMADSGDWAVAITTTAFAALGLALYLVCFFLQGANVAPRALTPKQSSLSAGKDS